MAPSIDALRQRHADYTGPLGTTWWTLARDAYQGTGGFRVAVQTATTDSYGAGDYEDDGDTPVSGSYLVRYPRETGQRFYRRQVVSFYRNHVAPIVQEYAGHLWRRGPQRETTDDEVTRWWADVDGQGTGVDAWLSSLTQRLQLFGWCAVLVDRPAGDTSEAEARTYARALQPEELVDWQLGSDGRLDWARLCTATVDRDPWTGESTARETYTTWTSKEWQRVTLTERDGAWSVEEESEVTPHTLGRVPVAILYWQRPVDPGRLYGTSQVDGVVAANLELFNLCSEQREHERGQVFAVLCVQSQNPDVLQGLKLGTHNGIRVEPDAAFPAFIAPPESVGMTFGNRVESVTELIWSLAHLERPSAQPAGESGIARQWRFGQTRSVLTDATKRLAEGERDVLDLVLRRRYPGPSGASARAAAAAGTRIAWGSDFDVDDLDTVLSTRLAALKEPAAMVPETARAARLAVGRALNPDATPAEDDALKAQVTARYAAETLALQGAGQTTSQETALNGAQVTSLVDVVKAAALREIPRESAAQIITLAYPVDAAKADAILASIGRGFVPTPAGTTTVDITPRPTGRSDDGATAGAKEDDDAGKTDSAASEAREAA